MSLEKLTQHSTPDSAPRKRSWAWLLPTGLLIGFILIIGLLFGDRLIPATEVSTAPVITIRKDATESTNTPVTENSKGEMIFQASGWVEPDPYITFVPTLVDGIVDEVKLLGGQQVKKGDLLATLIDDDAKLNYQQAKQKIVIQQKRIDAHCETTHIIQAEISATQRKIIALQASFDEAMDKYQRLKKIPSGSVSKQQVVAADLAQQRQSALVAEAKAQIPKLKAREKQIESERLAMTAQIDELETMRNREKLALDRTRITAPMDGIILHMHAAPGKKRILGMDDPKSSVIAEIYNPNKLQARIDVPLSEAANMQHGQHVELSSDLLPNVTFHGIVTLISGEADLQRNTLQAKVTIKNPDIRLKPEMLVRAKFFATGKGNQTAGSNTAAGRLAIYVPESALVNKESVWVVDPNGQAELRTIQLSTESRDSHLRVLEGLRSGEKVILPPHNNLTTGKRLKISN